MKISEIIRTLIILFFTEAIIAVVLYSAGILVKHDLGFIGFIFVLKGMHFLFYYWILFIVYYLNEDFSATFYCVTNVVVFLGMSVLLTVFLTKDPILFFHYSFVCNLIGILLAPHLLEKINNKLPSHLRIY